MHQGDVSCCAITINIDMIQHICKGCSIPFDSVSTKTLFCSRVCYNKHRLDNTSAVVKTCICGSPVSVSLGHMKRYKAKYCSFKCTGIGKQKRKIVNCANCGSPVSRAFCHLKRNKLTFCNRVCQNSYFLLNPTSPIRRSKFEEWVETKIGEDFPTLQAKFNSRKDIGFELDIYIPELKIAFEINGPSHYVPIYGIESLRKKRKKGEQKRKACSKHSIKYHVINISKLKDFYLYRTKHGEPYWQKIRDFICERFPN